MTKKTQQLVYVLTDPDEKDVPYFFSSWEELVEQVTSPDIGSDFNGQKVWVLPLDPEKAKTLQVGSVRLV
jgi:hypothetical protein